MGSGTQYIQYRNSSFYWELASSLSMNPWQQQDQVMDLHHHKPVNIRTSQQSDSLDAALAGETNHCNTDGQKRKSSSYRFLWRSGWRPPRRSLRNCPLRREWTRSSTPSPWRCPSWPGPGRSLAVPLGRRSRSECCRSALGQWTHSWSGGSGDEEDEEDGWLLVLPSTY